MPSSCWNKPDGQFYGKLVMTMQVRTAVACAVLVSALVAGVLYAAADSHRVAHKAKRVTESPGLKAGMLDGHPYIGNESVCYVWTKPEDGAGLLSIYDRASGKWLLEVDVDRARMWRIEAKQGEKKENRTYENVGRPCTVTTTVDEGEAVVSFVWSGDVSVEVVTRLAADETLARSEINVHTQQDDEGLVNVTFPVVHGILPLAENAADDRVLFAFRSGYTRPSPLVTGKPLKMQYCIEYNMQLAALLGSGRGLYFGDHDPTTSWKDFSWTPDADTQTLSYAVSHPVLGWGGPEPVTHYGSPGDCVLGPFQGDWYDAARIYRRWAITAPWCAKGPMHQRDDYPKWFLNIDYWAFGHLGDHLEQKREFVKRDLFDFPITVTHDYGHFNGWTIHDAGPEYFPPKPGSENYKRVLGELKSRGARVVPYVMGWMWNGASEDFQLRKAKEKGAMLGKDSQSVLWAELEPSEENIAMCPASKIWRDKLTEVSVEFVKRYRTGGIYFDYFSTHMNDCFNPDHGHALGGGDYWGRGVHDLFRQVRDEVHKIDPETMLCAEDLAEFGIDVLDAAYVGITADAPVWQVVYHDYTQLFGGMHWMEAGQIPLSRQWLYGRISQLPGSLGFPDSTEVPGSQVDTLEWYRDLMRCSHEFARPYLGYGEMLRPPEVSGDIPILTMESSDGPFKVSAVEGTAWRAPDGSVGIFFINYEDQPRQFTWKTDLAEIAGLDASKRLQITQWTVDNGARPLKQTEGGIVGETVEIPPHGMIALKLEKIP